MNINNNYIIIFTIIRIILGLMFSSDYSDELFIPFIQNAIGKIIELESPWDFLEQSNLDRFPYHPLMLYMYLLFQIPAYFFNFSFYPSKLLFLLPTIIFDFLLFIVMNKLFPNKNKEIYFFYGFSPIVLYGIYMHGQLDMLPTFLLFFSIYNLNIKKLNRSAIFIALSACFKLNTIAALPLLIIYIYKNYSFKKAVIYLLQFTIIYSFISIPWFFDPGFQSMVLSNNKQNLIFEIFYKVGDNHLFLSIFAILVIYIRFLAYYKINFDLLITWIAVLFSIFVLFIPPAPGWYLWIIPYLIVFYLKYLKKKIEVLALYGFLSFSYCLFFIFIWNGDYIDLKFLGDPLYLKIENYKISGLIFTILQVSLMVNLFAIYRYGVRSNRIYFRTESILIGIGGDSGSGKSTLLHSLQNILSHSVTLLEGDGDHRWERGNLKYQKFTHLNPRANYLERQAENLIRLKRGEIIYRPDYDHETGQFTEPIPIKPSDFIILSGLHSFYLPKMRKVTDIKIFIDTDERLRIHWKVIRDTSKRGYSIEEIKKQLENRKIDSEKYIKPQRDFADLLIEYYPVTDFIIGDASSIPEICLKITMSSEYHIEDIVLQMEEKNWLEQWDYGSDLKSQYFIFSKKPEGNELNNLSKPYFESLDNINFDVKSLIGGYEGIIQLFILIMIEKKYREIFNA